MLKDKILIFLISLFVFSQSTQAHLYRKQVCYAYKQTPTTVAITPLHFKGKPNQTPRGLFSYLSKSLKETKAFMRCLSKAIDRFPALHNGFSLSFENGRGGKKSHLKFILKAPIFYAGTHFLNRVDTKQSIQLKQPYSSFNEYRHLLFLLDEKGNEFGTGYRGLYKNHTRKMPHSHWKDQRDNESSIAFKEFSGDIVIIPKGGYLTLYDFSKKASEQELVDFWRMVLDRMNELEKQRMPYQFISVSGSAAGQRVPHFSVRLKNILGL